MADKIVTYSEPSVSEVRKVVLNFDQSGAFLNMIFDIDVASDSTDQSRQLGTRRMSGGAEASDLNPGQMQAVGVILQRVIEKFLTDEGF